MVLGAPSEAGGEARGLRGTDVAAPARRRLVCRGAVQGVGFRPAVHRLATSLGLAGWVRNGAEGAEIEVEGPPPAVERFLRDFPGSMPPLARLASMSVEDLPSAGGDRFEVRGSRTGRRRGALVPPDAALCAACRHEMEDPSDRRHAYPFTTCTGCGPRFSLTLALPYDRERTSMGCFPLCAACRREYEDPADRRFHAEPVCCALCGPVLHLLDGAGRPLAKRVRALAGARGRLAEGGILAVKGLGGFQLAALATEESVVHRLRERKRRPSKPFAVMVRDLEAARLFVEMEPGDEEILQSARAPIVLGPARHPSMLAAGIAPGLDEIGLMLPTTPLHVELFRGASYDALIMTSGNLGDEPIARGNREAVARLAGLADAFLVHDRDVIRRVDDSVVRSSHEGPFVVRRSRGWVPDPLPLPDPVEPAILALGAHLQATACVACGAEAIPSQHVGDLDNDAARAFLREVATGLEEFLQVEASVIAVDLHPDYASTWIGEEIAAARGARLLRIQHHLAHAAAVLAETGSFPSPGGRAAAIVLDGTGLGTDGTAWGGEWLLLDGDLRWSRRAHLSPLPLVGGESAVREPWRVAAAALALEGEARLLDGTPMARKVPPARLAQAAALSASPALPRASGAGRIFEAAGALCGLAVQNSYEGEAAARFEALAGRSLRPPSAWPELAGPGGSPAGDLSGSALLAAAARRLAAGEDPADVAAGFHDTFCALAARRAEAVFPSGIAVALGGGCFVNRRLRAGLSRRLAAAGFRPLLPMSLPPGDGGIAYGQAVLAAASVARRTEPVEEGGV